MRREAERKLLVEKAEIEAASAERKAASTPRIQPLARSGGSAANAAAAGGSAASAAAANAAAEVNA